MVDGKVTSVTGFVTHKHTERHSPVALMHIHNAEENKSKLKKKTIEFKLGLFKCLY